MRPMQLGLVALSAAVAMPGTAMATDQQARDMLRAMSDYIGRQAFIETAVDTSVEVVTPKMEKLSFVSSTTVRMARPNRVRVSRTGGYADAEIIVDGATMTVRNKAANRFAQVPVQGGIDALIETLHQQAGLAMPAADLLVRDSYAVLSDDVIEAKVIGEGVVGGQVCDHLAFRNSETDWQIWIRQGPDKIPCKMVITSKTVGMAPQYTMHVRSWATPAGFAPDTFTFRPAAGETRVDPGQLGGIDELPPQPSTGAPR